MMNIPQKISYTFLKVQAGLNRPFGAYHGLHLPFCTRNWKFVFKEIFIEEIYRFTAKTDRPFIIDCGANVGFAALYFKKLYPNARVLCFEASADTYQKLKNTIQENHLTDVTLEKVALSDEDRAEVTFYKNSTDGCDLGASLNSRGRGSSEKVETRKLSEYFSEPVDFIKIDIEGGETKVIRELAAANKLHLIRQGLIEFHISEKNPENNLPALLKPLLDHGFTYRFIDLEKPDELWENQQLMLISFKKKELS